jgi:hypothetical protein
MGGLNHISPVEDTDLRIRKPFRGSDRHFANNIATVKSWRLPGFGANNNDPKLNPISSSVTAANGHCVVANNYRFLFGRYWQPWSFA